MKTILGLAMLSLAFATLLTGCVATSGSSPRIVASRTPEASARGKSVADNINARYDDYVKEQCSDGSAAYYCSGVIYRGVLWTVDYYFWNNKQNPADDGVSFSYVRKDSGSRWTFYPMGYVLLPGSEWGKEGMLSLSVYCSFPFDGYTTGDRGPHGCDEHVQFPVESRPCAEQGIDSVAKFARHYALQSGDEAARWAHSCSFSAGMRDWKSFHLSILARQGGALEPTVRRHSEMKVSNWKVDVPSQVPIEALYYDFDYSDSAGALAHSRCQQADFFHVTGRILPILRWHRNLKDPLFTYVSDDQGDLQDCRAISSEGVPQGGAPLGWHGE